MQISGGKFSHKKLKDLNTEKAMHLNGEEYTALIKGGNADEFHTHDFQELLEEYFKNHSFGGGGGGGGASAWTQLTDTPFAIQASKGVRGNATGDALEFYDIVGDSDEKVKVSANDTTADYLLEKLSAGTGISIVETGDGENESITITNMDKGSTAVSSHESTYNHGDLHSRQHAIDATPDHTGVTDAIEDNFISFNASGLPKDSGKSSSDFLGANRIVETKTDNYVVTISDAAKTLVMNAATEKNFTLPSVSVSNLGLWFTFVKIGAGKLVIAAANSDVIADSGVGKTIYNDQPNETYATITLQLVTETNWVITGAHGIWVTTE